jgi:hypothetical protein
MWRLIVNDVWLIDVNVVTLFITSPDRCPEVPGLVWASFIAPGMEHHRRLSPQWRHRKTYMKKEEW